MPTDPLALRLAYVTPDDVIHGGEVTELAGIVPIVIAPAELIVRTVEPLTPRLSVVALVVIALLVMPM